MTVFKRTVKCIRGGLIDDRLCISLSTALDGKLKYFWEFLLSPDDHALAGTILIFSTAFS